MPNGARDPGPRVGSMAAILQETEPLSPCLHRPTLSEVEWRHSDAHSCTGCYGMSRAPRCSSVPDGPPWLQSGAGGRTDGPDRGAEAVRHQAERQAPYRDDRGRPCADGRTRACWPGARALASATSSFRGSCTWRSCGVSTPTRDCARSTPWRRPDRPASWLCSRGRDPDFSEPAHPRPLGAPRLRRDRAADPRLARRALRGRGGGRSWSAPIATGSRTPRPWCASTTSRCPPPSTC